MYLQTIVYNLCILHSCPESLFICLTYAVCALASGISSQNLPQNNSMRPPSSRSNLIPTLLLHLMPVSLYTDIPLPATETVLTLVPRYQRVPTYTNGSHWHPHLRSYNQTHTQARSRSPHAVIRNSLMFARAPSRPIPVTSSREI